MTKTKEITENTQPKKIVKKNLAGLNKNAKEIEVLIMNNLQGNFYYECPKTHIIIEMQNYGDVEVVTLDVLNAMKNSYKNILDNYWILIADVYSDDYTIEDIVQFLRLKEKYKFINSLLEKDKDSKSILDKIILNSSVKKFKEIINSLNNSLLIRLSERAVSLYKQKIFKDKFKMDTLAEALNEEVLALFDK